MRNAVQTKSAAKVVERKNSILKIAFSSFITVSLLLALFVFGSKSYADNKDPAELEKAKEFIEAFADRAIAVLNNKELSEEDAIHEYRAILNDSFAIPYIARITLSRHRKKASKQELDEYTKLFPEFILKVNSSRLRQLDTTKLDIGEVKPYKKSDILIRTKAYNAENKSLDVDWRVRSDKNGVVKIIDVLIEGISMVRTQRDDFTSRVTQSGIGNLNQYMKDIIDGKVVAEEEA